MDEAQQRRAQFTLYQAFKRIFRRPKDTPRMHRTTAVRIGAIAIMAGLINMFWAINLESTEGPVRYNRTNTEDFMAIQPDVRSLMETSVVPPQLLNELQNIEGIEATGVTIYFSRLEGRDTMMQSYQKGSSMQPLLAAGRHLQADNETVIDTDMADSLGIKLGSTIQLLRQPFRVVGLSRETGSFGKEMVFISQPAMNKLYGAELYNAIAINTHGKPLDPKLIKKWSDQADFITKQEFIQGTIDYWKRNVSGLILTPIGAVSVLGLLSIVVILAKQLDLQMQELGLKRALGASRFQVSALEATIMAILVFIGWLVAMPLGWLLIQRINEKTAGFHATLSLETVMVSAFCIVPVSAIAIWRLWRRAGKANAKDLIVNG